MHMRANSKSLISVLLFLVILILPVSGVSYPAASGYVNDFASVIDSSTEREIEQIAQALSRDGEIEIAVVTVPSLEGESLEEYSYQLATAWGIGVEGQDTGLMLLLAVEERQVRVEVGYGLEGDLPDGLVGRLLDEHVIPPFKEGDYSRGLLQGTLSLAATLAQKRSFTLQVSGSDQYAVSEAEADPIGEIISFLVMMVFIFFFVGRGRLFPLLFLMGMSGRSNRHYGGGFGSSGRGGGFGGGGFGGFSGGGFGGGGASRGF